MTISVKSILATSIIAGISYQTYTKFKDFINNIVVSTTNYTKNLDNSFNITLLLQNRFSTIMPYKLAKIEFVNDDNQVIAISDNAAYYTASSNLKFYVKNEQLIPSNVTMESYFNTLDVVLYFNFFLFTHSRKYKQMQLNVVSESESNTDVDNESQDTDLATQVATTSCSCKAL